MALQSMAVYLAQLLSISKVCSLTRLLQYLFALQIPISKGQLFFLRHVPARIRINRRSKLIETINMSRHADNLYWRKLFFLFPYFSALLWFWLCCACMTLPINRNVHVSIFHDLLERIFKREPTENNCLMETLLMLFLQGKAISGS